MNFKHQSPLEGYDKRIGGSAGKGTHGTRNIDIPDEYIPRNKWDYEVSSSEELVKRIQEDDVVVGLDQSVDKFNVDGYNEISPGKNTALIGHYCNPNCIGRGPVIRKTHYDKCFLKTRQPFHMYGVSMRGPNRSYFDPRERVKSSDWNSDKEEDWYTAGVWVMTNENEPVSNFVGCEFWGWTWAGVAVGAKNYQTQARFKRCSFHECLMETMGYGVTQFDGHVEFDLCFFDTCRHAVAGFGYPTESCRIKRCLAGPGPYAGHVFDRHELTDENPVAGKWIRVSDTTIMVDKDVGGYGQEGLKIRGRPEELAWIKRCHFPNKDGKPSEPGGPGEAYYQEGEDVWHNFLPEDNHYGQELRSGYGAPREEDKKAAKDEDDVSPSDPKGEESKTPGQELTIHGKDVDATYTITVDGDVAKTSNIDKAVDSVKNNKNGTVTIHGYVKPGDDTYRLAKDAQMIRFGTTGLVDVTLNGESVDLTIPVAADITHRLDNLTERIDGLDPDASSKTVQKLQDRVDALSKKLGKAHIEF